MLQWKVSVACLRIWICTIGTVVIVPLEYTWSPSIVLIWMISAKLCLWLFPRVIESESQLKGFIQCGIFCFWKTHFSLFCMRPHFPTQCFTGLGSAGALSPVNWRHQGRWRKQWQFSLKLFMTLQTLWQFSLELFMTFSMEYWVMKSLVFPLPATITILSRAIHELFLSLPLPSHFGPVV